MYKLFIINSTTRNAILYLKNMKSHKKKLVKSISFIAVTENEDKTIIYIFSTCFSLLMECLKNMKCTVQQVCWWYHKYMIHLLRLIKNRLSDGSF